MNNVKTVKGFTLIELLVVIGILAVLSVVIILTLNPAELLKQAKDSTRISDLGAIRTAISLYQVDVADPKFGDSANCYYSATIVAPATIAAGCQVDPDGAGAAAAFPARFTGGAATAPASAVAIDGNGWVRVNIGGISTGAGGPPIASLPHDPINSATTNNFYAYRAGGNAGCNDTTSPRCTTFEINVALESAKFYPQAQNDGGNANGATGALYEVGTDPGLDL